MNADRKRARRRVMALMVVAIVATLPRAATADPASPPALTDPEPRCHREEDLACTVVRETSIGVWVWTERFRPGDSSSSGWTLAVGPLSPTRLVIPSPPAHTTANDAPILE